MKGPAEAGPEVSWSDLFAGRILTRILSRRLHVVSVGPVATGTVDCG
jgi:hypothetical protein